MTGENTTANETTMEGPYAWSPTRRFYVSLIIAFHLLCIFVAPMASVDPRSGLAVDMQRVLRPYTESLYLGHGYRFFAPEPGPSHSIHYVITQDDGQTLQGHFPDREQMWPRLLYHRWFMLSETVFGQTSESLGEEELTEWRTQVESRIASLQDSDPRAADELQSRLNQEIADNQRIAAMRDELVTAIGKTLLQQHGGQVVEITLKTRVIPPPEDIAIGLKLDNERYMPDELSIPLGKVYRDRNQLESIPPPVRSTPADPETEQGRGGGL